MDIHTGLQCACINWRFNRLAGAKPYNCPIRSPCHERPWEESYLQRSDEPRDEQIAGMLMQLERTTLRDTAFARDCVAAIDQNDALGERVVHLSSEGESPSVSNSIDRKFK
ncbi:hypothetical protein [Paraburkholderia sp. BR10954]|uniref:hypothetical protein n=1 Tax=Paraburkholderia sp. BR10954 TaxID=3236995 RepID=UPI0034D2BCE4